MVEEDLSKIVTVKAITARVLFDLLTVFMHNYIFSFL